MPPKKTVPTSSVGTESNGQDLETDESDAVDSVSRSKGAAHPPAMVMVKEAVKELDSQKGVSSQAIRNRIKLKYPTMDLVRLKYTVRKALIKGLENGTLVRPAKAAAGATGAQGRFRLAPKKATEPKQKTENSDPNVEKPKATKAARKMVEGADKEPGTGKKKDSKKKNGTTEAKKTDEATASNVAPAKKPKAKKGAVNMEASGEISAVEPKAKEAKAKAKEPKAKAPKATKEKASVKDDKPEGDGAKAPAAAGRRGKKTTE